MVWLNDDWFGRVSQRCSNGTKQTHSTAVQAWLLLLIYVQYVLHMHDYRYEFSLFSHARMRWSIQLCRAPKWTQHYTCYIEMSYSWASVSQQIVFQSFRVTPCSYIPVLVCSCKGFVLQIAVTHVLLMTLRSSWIFWTQTAAVMQIQMCFSIALFMLDSCMSHASFTCEPVHVQWCHGMPYNTTFFPNMLEHYDQHIAAVKMKVCISVAYRHVRMKMFVIYTILTKLLEPPSNERFEHFSNFHNV